MFISKKILHQTLACSPVIFLQVMIGTFNGWGPPTIAKLTNRQAEYYITPDQASWFVSIHEVGKLMGPFVSPLLVDNLGRKYTLVIVAVIYFVFWSSVIITRNIHILCILRVLSGLGNGINDVVAAIYTTENCSPNFRGIVGSIIILLFYVAVFSECVLASYSSYLYTAIVNTVIAAGAFTSLYFCTETPYFLVMKGKREKAKENFIWLSGGDTTNTKAIDEELQKIETSIQEEKMKKQNIKALLSSTANLKGILVVVGMNVLGMATGSSAFMAYSSLIFRPSGMLTAKEFTILVTTAPFLAVVVSTFIIEKINRRSLVIAGNVGSTLSNVCSFCLIYLYNRGHEITYYPWLIFASISSYYMSCAFVAPAGYALRGELLPFSVRAIGSSMAVVGFSISAFSVSKSFLPIMERFGMETNVFVYVIVGLFNIIFLYYVLPETRGKTLHELQNLQKVKSTATENKRSVVEVMKKSSPA